MLKNYYNYKMMETKEKIHLTEEKETLFITLYAKALNSRSKRPILHDKTAEDIVENLDYDFSKHKRFGNNFMVIRARHFDDWLKDFIRANKDGIVLYLGCGLDTRISRISPPESINWYDVDYPDVIALRKNKTGAILNWAVDDTKEIGRLNSSLKKVTEMPLFYSPHMKKLPLGTRLIMKVLSRFSQYRNMMQLLYYQF